MTGNRASGLHSGLSPWDKVMLTVPAAHHFATDIHMITAEDDEGVVALCAAAVAAAMEDENLCTLVYKTAFPSIAKFVLNFFMVEFFPFPLAFLHLSFTDQTVLLVFKLGCKSREGKEVPCPGVLASGGHRRRRLGEPAEPRCFGFQRPCR